MGNSTATATPERPAYQQRVIEERDALSEKLGKLSVWLNGKAFRDTVPKDEQFRLRVQADVMRAYLLILDERIAHFTF